MATIFFLFHCIEELIEVKILLVIVQSLKITSNLTQVRGELLYASLVTTVSEFRQLQVGEFFLRPGYIYMLYFPTIRVSHSFLPILLASCFSDTSVVLPTSGVYRKVKSVALLADVLSPTISPVNHVLFGGQSAQLDSLTATANCWVKVHKFACEMAIST